MCSDDEQKAQQKWHVLYNVVVTLPNVASSRSVELSCNAAGKPKDSCKLTSFVANDVP
jgi:hypothetical protein